MLGFKDLFLVFYKFKGFLVSIPKKFFIFSFLAGFSGGVGAGTARNLGFGITADSDLSKVGESSSDISRFLGDDSNYYSNYDFEEDYIFPYASKGSKSSSEQIQLELSKSQVSLQEA